MSKRWFRGRVFLILVLFLAGLIVPDVFAFDWSGVLGKIKAATATIIITKAGKAPEGINAPVIDATGLILTNWHVYEWLKKLKEKEADVKIKIGEQDEQYDWYLLGADPLNDLALLKLKTGKNFPFSEIKKENPREGEELLCLGAPNDYPFTITTGIVGRLWVDNAENWPYIFLQHSAETFFGNSGSGIYNIHGQIIALHMGGSQMLFGFIAGQYYAIPSGVLSQRLPRIRQGWRLKKGKKKSILKPHGLLEPDKNGLLVWNIKDSIFDGLLQKDDIIIRAERVRISSEEFLKEVMEYSYLPGESMKLLVLRKENKHGESYWEPVEISIPLPKDQFEKIKDDADKNKESSK